MINLALLGCNISHSLSPKLYEQIYAPERVSYQLLDHKSENEIPTLEKIFHDLDGLSITAPYKKHFFKNVVISDERVAKLGAINCIGRKNNKFYATNTDLSALRRLLPALVGSKEVLILGSGVMANLVKIVCSEYKVKFINWSRGKTPNEFAAMDLTIFEERQLVVINCCAREYKFTASLPKSSVFWDMNYKHLEHDSLFSGANNYIDGFNLLKAQAQDAAAFWSSLKN